MSQSQLIRLKCPLCLTNHFTDFIYTTAARSALINSKYCPVANICLKRICTETWQEPTVEIILLVFFSQISASSSSQRLILSYLWKQWHWHFHLAKTVTCKSALLVFARTFTVSVNNIFTHIQFILIKPTYFFVRTEVRTSWQQPGWVLDFYL